VIARNPIKRNIDPAQNFQRLGKKVRIFNQIAGKTNKIRFFIVDRRDDFFEEPAISFVMDVREMDKALPSAFGSIILFTLSHSGSTARESTAVMLGNVIIPAMNFRRVSRNAFTSLGQHRCENVSLNARKTGL